MRQRTRSETFQDNSERRPVLDRTTGIDPFRFGRNPEAGNFAREEVNLVERRVPNHRQRRTVMFAGADDGAMHAFDAGLWDGSYAQPQTDAGTGRELFAWVPTSVMEHFPDLRTGVDHRYTVDGAGTVADVFIEALDEASARKAPSDSKPSSAPPAAPAPPAGQETPK